MDFRLTPAQTAFRDEVRAFLQNEVTDELRAEVRRLNMPGPFTAAFKKRLAERNWLGIAWPVEYGGMGHSFLEQYLLLEELEYAEAPPLSLSITSIGPTLMKVGTEEQKRSVLPRILQGGEIALGYSEADAGSDLASMKCRAVADGDWYVVNGQKMYTSAAHYSSHIWLAARTNPDVPGHRGLSIFLVPTDSKGLTIRPVWTMGEGRLNDVFFDGVRVPRDALVGEPGRGWYYMMMALDFERASLAPYSLLQRLLEDLVALVRWDMGGLPRAREPRARWLLADLAVRVHVARLLALRTAELLERGQTPQHEAHIQKIFRSDTLREITSVGMQILGLYGQLEEGSPRAMLAGKFSRLWQITLRTTIGAGTNEILRTSVATRGLGLPR